MHSKALAIATVIVFYDTQTTSLAEEIAKIYENCDDFSDIVLGAGTKDSSETFLNKDLDIVSNHAYAVKPHKTESGDILFEVINPWHTYKSTTLTTEEFSKYFESIYYTKIKKAA